MKLAIATRFPWFLLALAFVPDQQDAAPIKATIAASCAPWDGSAFVTTIPADGFAGATSGAVIRISIWQSPTLKDSVSFHCPDMDGRTGSAYYSAGNATPVALNGRVSFQSVQLSAPVFGDFDLVSPAGVRYRARFEAAWVQVRALCG